MSAPRNAKLIVNVAILTPDRALLVRYGEGHDGEAGWMLADDLLNQGEPPDSAAGRVAREHPGITTAPKLVFVESFTGGDGTWYIAFNYVAEFTHAVPIKPGPQVAGTGWFMLDNLPERSVMAHRGWALRVLEQVVAARGR